MRAAVKIQKLSSCRSFEECAFAELDLIVIVLVVVASFARFAFFRIQPTGVALKDKRRNREYLYDNNENMQATYLMMLLLQ